MKIIIETTVEQPFKNVWAGFNENLLKKLSPPFPKATIVSFGHEINEKVEIVLNFFILRQRWVSIISERKIFDEYAFFTDEGIILPFFLKYWKHKHSVKQLQEGSLIIDEIEFRTPTILTDYIFYPLLYLQFIYRKPIYKKIFLKNEN